MALRLWLTFLCCCCAVGRIWITMLAHGGLFSRYYQLPIAASVRNRPQVTDGADRTCLQKRNGGNNGITWMSVYMQSCNATCANSRILNTKVWWQSHVQPFQTRSLKSLLLGGW
jgi:hypothetical protein